MGQADYLLTQADLKTIDLSKAKSELQSEQGVAGNCNTHCNWGQSCLEIILNGVSNSKVKVLRLKN
jgi:hypothetical protein